MLPVVVVHGGAGHVPKERAEDSIAGVREAARKGYAILKAGGSAMDAVVETVAMLENNPAYNAGSALKKKERDRAFAVTAPRLWNQLPPDIKCAPSISDFKVN